MKIKYKISTLTILSILPFIAITYLVFNYAYFGYIDKQQERELKKGFESIRYIIENEENNMQGITNDWAMWDDTYKFIKNPNQQYINSNLSGNALPAINLNMMVFLNSKGNVVYSRSSGINKSIIESLAKKIIENNGNVNNKKTGILLVKNNAFIVAIAPITDSRMKLKSNGSFIIVRKIDSKLLSYIKKLSNFSLKISYFKQSNYSNVDKKIYNGKEYLQSNRLIKDIYGKSSIIFSIKKEDLNYRNMRYYFKIFIELFLIMALIFILMDFIVLDKFIFKRLSKLNNFIDNVTATKNLTLRIKMSGKDEIYKLAQDTNTMLSELNNANKELLFLSYSDKLTNLKNRAYMENMFEELDKDKNSKYFIAVGDIDGLKLINDTLGHREGDKLIYDVSKILRELCESDDIVSRWSGNEFVILIRNKDDIYLYNLINKIKQTIGQISDCKASIAFGYAKKNDTHADTEAVMRVAEKRMYRNKLVAIRSSRNSTILSLLNTLNEKHTETREHTMRIKNLSSKLGKKLGLTQAQLDELELLALLHDIGKIGIPDQILTKPGKLTNEEWEVMKTHTEIGYRIAKATPALSHITDGILFHHEKYDGTGYTQGLKGEEIPILARIINVVDSFDVMTHKRAYKEASNMDYAIEELKRCSGTQFDPFIAEEFIKLLKEEENNI